MHAAGHVILAVACLGMLLAHPGGVTAAFVFDLDTSGANPVAGGTLDTKLTEDGPATQDGTTDEAGEDGIEDTWQDFEHDSPLSSDTAVNNTVRIDNTGSSLDADRVNVTVTYVENDSEGSLTSGNADETARTLVVESLTYKDTDRLGSEVVDENNDGDVDLEDLTLGQTASNLSQLSGLTASGTADLRIVIDGDRGLLSPVGSDDGLDITVTITARAGGFEDADKSRNNTIIYA
jgi:hypothetical protein